MAAAASSARGVHEQPVARQHRKGDDDHCRRLHGIPAGERTLRPEPVARVRGERCDQDCGDELEERNEPDLLGSAALQRVEQHGQPGGVLADGEPGVRQQDPSELTGPTDAEDDRQTAVVHARNHATAKGIELVAMWANTGAIRCPDRWRSQTNPSPATNVATNVPTIGSPATEVAERDVVVAPPHREQMPQPERRRPPQRSGPDVEPAPKQAVQDTAEDDLLDEHRAERDHHQDAQRHLRERHVHPLVLEEPGGAGNEGGDHHDGGDQPCRHQTEANTGAEVVVGQPQLVSGQADHQPDGEDRHGDQDVRHEVGIARDRSGACHVVRREPAQHQHEAGANGSARADHRGQLPDVAAAAAERWAARKALSSSVSAPVQPSGGTTWAQAPGQARR